MAKQKFHKIALMGRKGVPGVEETLSSLVKYLQQQKCEVVLETSAAEILPASLSALKISAKDLPKRAELLIVVGGDGSLLNASQTATKYNLPVLGINRGRLGFLTDIHPQELEKIGDILNGNYELEKRFLLEATFENEKGESDHYTALNDVVLLPGDIAQMIEFNLYVNKRLVCHHRADGMIIASPTGSTAYALSGGGPILHPSLEAIVLVPMFPHTLSSRPIVISSDSIITIDIVKNNDISPYLSCDGQNRVNISPGSKISIKKSPDLLQLIHPEDYSYFHTLREKLNWEKQATRPPF